MEGCSAPLVVKFADTQKEKEQKKVQQMQAAILSNIKGSGNSTTGSLTMSPGIASESITPTLTGANGSVVTAASLPINLGLSSSGKISKNIFKNLIWQCGYISINKIHFLVQANGLVTVPNATALTSSSSLMNNPPQTVNPFIGADALSTSSLQFLQQMQAVGLQQQFLQGIFSNISKFQ